MTKFLELSGALGTPFMIRSEAVEYVIERPSAFVPGSIVRVVFTTNGNSSFEVVETMEEIKKRLGIDISPRAETLALNV